MKLELIVANEEALKTLVETKFDDAQIAWDLSEAFDDVEKVITKFQKKRDAFVKKVGTPDKENPERFNIDDPEAFQEEMLELLAVEVDIKFPSIPISKLKGLKVSVKEIRSWKTLGIISNGKPLEIKEIEKVGDKAADTINK